MPRLLIFKGGADEDIYIVDFSDFLYGGTDCIQWIYSN
jgi:hypothetical protein